ncbi:hypothetical protein D3C72_721600 [compost metagenome]
MEIRVQVEGIPRLADRLRVDAPSKQAEVYSDLVYMPRLEKGWSAQAPEGMVRPNLPEAEQQFRRNVIDAVDAIAQGADADAELAKAVDDAALSLLNRIVPDTPIRTGRARASWEITLTSGEHHDSVSLGLTGPPIAEE